MKTIEEVRTEMEAEEPYVRVMTTKDFYHAVAEGCFNSFDGSGYFHDGKKETRVYVFDESLTKSDIKKYPYVCWYNG